MKQWVYSFGGGKAEGDGAMRDLLGVQLDNGARVAIRPRNGKLSLYYRVQF